MASSHRFFQAIKVIRSYPLPVIASISGTVSRVGLTDAVIEVNGLGYLVNVTTRTALELKVESAVKLHICHIIREDSQALFGFPSEDELLAFNLLCSVSGVGPKSALSVVGSLGVEGLSKAVASADDSMFRSVSGIGPKTAKLIVLSLTGKLVSVSEHTAPTSSQVANVTSALVGLGYQERNVRKTVEEAASTHPQSNEQELLRFVLAQLSSARKIDADE
jgi:Holliday junction DNA helicase RuvA